MATIELPVVFSAQEVRAVLDGRKTQFRRLVKGVRLNIGPSNSNYKVLDTYLVDGELYFLYERNGHKYRDLTTKCPFGEPGTRLWVRETWAIAKGIINESSKGQYLYKASHGYTQGGVEPDLATWCRSITMPRLASRITLEVTYIRKAPDLPTVQAQRTWARTMPKLHRSRTQCVDWAVQQLH